MADRLQKVLAAAGIGSRRACEEWITQGRVKVDGKVVNVLGTCVDPALQRILFDNRPVALAGKKYYIVLNKPKGYTSSLADPHAGRLVTELVDIQGGPFLRPVGRLDVETEGLLFLSNDGEFINLMTHPRYHVPKTYRAAVRGVPHTETLRKLSDGVTIEAGVVVKADNIRIRRTFRNDAETELAEVEMTIHQGRNRQVRRMFAVVGHPVTTLTRVAIGKVTLGGLASGAWRHLTQKELASFQSKQAELPINKPTQEKAYRWQNAPSHSIQPKGRSSSNSSSPKPRAPRQTSSTSSKRDFTTG